MDEDERDAKRAAYGPVREAEERERRKIALFRSATRGSAAAAAAETQAGKAGGASATGGGGGGGDNFGGSGGGGDAELEEANRGLPARWIAQRSRSGQIYWFYEGRYDSGQWTRPGADAVVQQGGARLGRL